MMEKYCGSSMERLFVSNIGSPLSSIRIIIGCSMLCHKLGMQLLLLLLKPFLQRTQLPIHKLLLSFRKLCPRLIQRDDKSAIFAFHHHRHSFPKTKLPKPYSLELDLRHILVMITAMCTHLKFSYVLCHVLSSFFNRLLLA